MRVFSYFKTRQNNQKKKWDNETVFNDFHNLDFKGDLSAIAACSRRITKIQAVAGARSKQGWCGSAGGVGCNQTLVVTCNREVRILDKRSASGLARGICQSDFV